MAHSEHYPTLDAPTHRVKRSFFDAFSECTTKADLPKAKRRITELFPQHAQNLATIDMYWKDVDVHTAPNVASRRENAWGISDHVLACLPSPPALTTIATTQPLPSDDDMAVWLQSVERPATWLDVATLMLDAVMEKRLAHMIACATPRVLHVASCRRLGIVQSDTNASMFHWDASTTATLCRHHMMLNATWDVLSDHLTNDTFLAKLNTHATAFNKRHNCEFKRSDWTTCAVSRADVWCTLIPLYGYVIAHLVSREGTVEYCGPSRALAS